MGGAVDAAAAAAVPYLTLIKLLMMPKTTSLKQLLVVQIRIIYIDSRCLGSYRFAL